MRLYHTRPVAASESLSVRGRRSTIRRGSTLGDGAQTQGTLHLHRGGIPSYAADLFALRVHPGIPQSRHDSKGSSRGAFLCLR